MKVIWKFKIASASNQFDGPAGAKPIASVVQPDGQPVLYLLCEVNAPPAKHQVSLFATAAHIPDDAGDHVGTLTIPSEQAPTGWYVMHVFHKQVGVQLAS